jgi:hypothetical protein
MLSSDHDGRSAQSILCEHRGDTCPGIDPDDQQILVLRFANTGLGDPKRDPRYWYQPEGIRRQ